MKPITWKNVQVDVSKIKPTPNNYKLKTEDGLERFKTSMKSFGLAGSVILNSDMTLIDGNTRWEQAKKEKHKKIWASIPSRKLTPKEFQEFSAMYDYARAGEVDLLRIKNEMGDTKSFFKKWGLEMPKEVLENLAEMEKAEGKVIATAKSLEKEQPSKDETKPLTLLFTVEENNTVLRKAESLYAKYKVDNITDLVYKIFTKVKL
jgi:hypothetical protein